MKTPRLLIGAGVVSAIIGIVILITISLQRPASAQQTSGNRNSPDIIADWDFGGMTREEKNAALHLMFPEQFTQAWLQNRKPKELAEDALSLLAATDPETYLRLNPVKKPPGQEAKEQADAWAISHPVEYTAMLLAAKKKNQREADAAAAWAITHPVEASQLEAATRKPAEEAKRAAAIFSITRPILKPKPLPKPEPRHDF